MTNIRAGARMLRFIQDNLGGPTSIAGIATLYNYLDAEEVSDFGARVHSVYLGAPWQEDAK